MAKKYPQIGAMIAKRDKETNKPILDKNGKQAYTIKVDKNVQLTVNGTPFTGYLNVSRPRDKFDRMLEKGSITPQEHAEKIKRYEKGGDLDYIQFELSCAIEE
jgi:flagellar basal body rod protein FlgF